MKTLKVLSIKVIFNSVSGTCQGYSDTSVSWPPTILWARWASPHWQSELMLLMTTPPAGEQASFYTEKIVYYSRTINQIKYVY